MNTERYSNEFDWGEWKVGWEERSFIKGLLWKVLRNWKHGWLELIFLWEMLRPHKCKTKIRHLLKSNDFDYSFETILKRVGWWINLNLKNQEFCAVWNWWTRFESFCAW